MSVRNEEKSEFKIRIFYSHNRHGEISPYTETNNTIYLLVLIKNFMLRSIRFEFSEETEVIGVNAYKYTLGENLVANASTNPENWCFNFKPDVDQV